MTNWRAVAGRVRDRSIVPTGRRCRRWLASYGAGSGVVLSTAILGTAALLATGPADEFVRPLDPETPATAGARWLLPWDVEVPAPSHFAPDLGWSLPGFQELPDLVVPGQGETSGSPASLPVAAGETPAWVGRALVAAGVVGALAVIATMRRRRPRLDSSAAAEDVDLDQLLHEPMQQQSPAQPAVDSGTSRISEDGEPPEPAPLDLESSGAAAGQAVVVRAPAPPATDGGNLDRQQLGSVRMTLAAVDDRDPSLLMEQEQSSRVVLFQRRSIWG